jgi:hypothetical protein
MAANRFPQNLRLVAWSILAAQLAGCGGGDPSGVYLPKHPDSPVMFFEKFDFQSGGKVAVTAFGNTAIGEYVVGDDDRVRVIMPQGNALTLAGADDGCLLAVSDPGLVAEAAKDGMDLNELGLICPE